MPNWFLSFFWGVKHFLREGGTILTLWTLFGGGRAKMAKKKKKVLADNWMTPFVKWIISAGKIKLCLNII